jgi:hypothetical protein
MSIKIKLVVGLIFGLGMLVESSSVLAGPITDIIPAKSYPGYSGKNSFGEDCRVTVDSNDIIFVYSVDERGNYTKNAHTLLIS